MKICEKCGNEFPTRIIIDGKQRNLCKRKYCLTCSPFNQHNTEKLVKVYKCTKCGETNPDNFTKGRYTECKKCRARYNTYKGDKNRIKAIQYLGGKCKCCGYDKFPCSLDIHHKDPLQKDPNFKHKRGWSWDRLKEELEKCILLCRNCHTAFHSGFIKEEDFKY